jgi:hypothetical protein
MQVEVQLSAALVSHTCFLLATQAFYYADASYMHQGCLKIQVLKLPRRNKGLNFYFSMLCDFVPSLQKNHFETASVQPHYYWR